MKGEKALNLLSIMIIILFLIIGFLIVYNAYHLSRFRKCYDSGFTLNYCEYYKNY